MKFSERHYVSLSLLLLFQFINKLKNRVIVLVILIICNFPLRYIYILKGRFKIKYEKTVLLTDFIYAAEWLIETDKYFFNFYFKIQILHSIK